ncbi:MAG: alpha/beta hydrolase [Alphaproteobacteria bacterium]|nr:alpha/beta hydrolase [Alphaproteobacteria bacterium]
MTEGTQAGMAGAAADSPPRGRRPANTRQGPRPLPLYLATAATTWLSSFGSSAALKAGLPPWNEALTPNRTTSGNQPSADALKIADLKAQLDALEAARRSAESSSKSAAPSFEEALDTEIRGRLDAFMRGVQAYREHPYHRSLIDPPVCWKDGSTRLLDYGAIDPVARDGHPVLVIPSLVNRGYVLDLTPERSLMRAMAARGFRPFLVDWDRPGDLERTFSLTDYIAGRLEAALEAVLVIAGKRPAVLGYCMGGALALALAQRRPRDTGPLALLATPWDFSADAPASAASLPAAEPWMGAMIDATGALPTDMIQTLFFSLDPMMVIRKFLHFAELSVESPKAREFVALEDWLNDGVPLSAPVAREALFGWYGRNTPHTGDWRIAGRAVDPREVRNPSLVMVPARDRIVPPASARALGDALPNAIRADIALGHIGMVVSQAAPARAWNTLFDWLDQNTD